MNITVSLATAKRLKAAGYPQDKSVLVWVRDDSYTRKFSLALRDDVSGEDGFIAAPTAEEIMSRPEVNVGPYVHLMRYPNGLYYCHSLRVRNGGDFNSAAEAAADFWLRAKEGK